MRQTATAWGIIVDGHLQSFADKKEKAEMVAEICMRGTDARVVQVTIVCEELKIDAVDALGLFLNLPPFARS